MGRLVGLIAASLFATSVNADNITPLDDACKYLEHGLAQEIEKREADTARRYPSGNFHFETTITIDAGKGMQYYSDCAHSPSLMATGALVDVAYSQGKYLISISKRVETGQAEEYRRLVGKLETAIGEGLADSASKIMGRLSQFGAYPLSIDESTSLAIGAFEKVEQLLERNDYASFRTANTLAWIGKFFAIRAGLRFKVRRYSRELRTLALDRIYRLNDVDISFLSYPGEVRYFLLARQNT